MNCKNLHLNLSQLFLNNSYTHYKGKLMSKLWIVFCMIVLASCTANPAKSVPTASPNPTVIPTAAAAIVPARTIATQISAPPLTSTEMGSGISLTPSLDVGDIHVRSGPATSYPTVGTLKAGEKASVIGTDPSSRWVLIEFP